MVILVGLALALLLSGLFATVFCDRLPAPLGGFVRITGIVLVVVGLVLLVTPVVIWLNQQIRAAFGV